MIRYGHMGLLGWGGGGLMMILWLLIIAGIIYFMVNNQNNNKSYGKRSGYYQREDRAEDIA